MDYEYFPNIKKIKYSPNSPKSDLLVYRHYNEDEVLHGKKMSEWLRFAVCYWHTFVWQGSDIFGNPTFSRTWCSNDQSPLSQAKAKVYAAFEFFSKLGVKYYCFHDRDMAPEGETLTETNNNLDVIVDIAEELQNKTGVKLLWGTSNLFSNKRYMNGASSNPNLNSFLYAGAQVKKMLEVTHKLKGENFVFWNGRDGYQTLLNTNLKTELDHMAEFLKMCVRYKNKIGFQGQFLIEPKAKEPTKHQYDYDAQTVMGFLKTYNLEKDFKLNIEPNHSMLSGHPFEHDIAIASAYNMLGSIDMNTGEASLGWDTDNFLYDVRTATTVMKIVIEQGGLGSGGLNFDCKVRRESTDLEDLFIAHIASIDCLALGLRKAVQMVEDGILSKLKNERYLSFETEDLGMKVNKGECNLEDCEDFIKKSFTNDIEIISSKQEKYDMIFNSYFS